MRPQEPPPATESPTLPKLDPHVSRTRQALPAASLVASSLALARAAARAKGEALGASCGPWARLLPAQSRDSVGRLPTAAQPEASHAAVPSPGESLCFFIIIFFYESCLQAGMCLSVQRRGQDPSDRGEGTEYVPADPLLVGADAPLTWLAGWFPRGKGLCRESRLGRCLSP